MEIQSLKVQISFSSSSYVSIESSDMIQIELTKEIFTDHFETKSPNQVIYIDSESVGRVYKLKVPHQLDPKQAEAIDTLTAATDDFFKTFFASNIFISIFSAGALQYLWGLVNVVQIVIMTSLFRLK